MRVPQDVAYRLGVEAERRAAHFLEGCGCRIIGRRFKVRQGEIDLISFDEQVPGAGLVAFVEVKARPTEEEALFAVTRKARQRIFGASEIWLQRNEAFAGCDQRFDIVIVLPDGTVKHFADAFRPWD